MGSQLLNAAKFGVLATIAFVGPQMITNSGSYLGNVEKKTESLDDEERLTSPAKIPLENNHSRTRPVTSTETSTLSGQQRHQVFFGAAKTDHKPFEKQIQNTDSSFEKDLPEDICPDCPITPMEEIFRFDRYPNWIIQRWKRVDTVAAAWPLYGYRVMVSTGREQDDLSGVLTYYYDQNGMKRMTFSGQTGDYQKILRFLQRRFGMTLREDATTREFTYESKIFSDHGKRQSPPSLLTIRPTQTFITTKRESFFSIDFDLYSP